MAWFPWGITEKSKIQKIYIIHFLKPRNYPPNFINVKCTCEYILCIWLHEHGEYIEGVLDHLNLGMLDYLKWGENMVGEGKGEEEINNDHIY